MRSIPLSTIPPEVVSSVPEIRPADHVHPVVLDVMREVGIDLSNVKPTEAHGGVGTKC
jgi:hypothetical protein